MNSFLKYFITIPVHCHSLSSWQGVSFTVEEGLYVSDAFHDVRVEVTEDGTKAAAATGEERCATVK